MQMGCVDDIGLDHQVFINELGRISIVGMYTADSGGSEINLIWLFCREKGVDRSLAGKVEFSMSSGDDVSSPLTLKSSHDSGTDHATVASDVDLGLFFHVHD